MLHWCVPWSLMVTLILALLPWMRGQAEAANRFWLPNLTLPQGATDVKVPLRAEHDVGMCGFSMVVRYDAGALRIDSVTTAGTSVAPPYIWVGSHEGGLIAYAAAFDIFGSVSNTLPPAPEHTLAMISLDLLAHAPAQPKLDLANNVPRGQATISNVISTIVDERVISVLPLLEDGAINISDPNSDLPPVAHAGTDQFAPELANVTLDASGSHSVQGLELSYQWTQRSGPLAQFISGADSATPAVSLPKVKGDQEVVFMLTVSDGLHEPATDEVLVSVVDLALRKGKLKKGGKARLLADGTRAVVFQGSMSWISKVEDASWSLLRFSAVGAGDESQLLTGVELFVDANANKVFDNADTQLGESAVLAGDNAQVEFHFSETLANRAKRGFFLVATLAEGAELAPVRQVRFDLLSPADVMLEGATTGVQVAPRGVPAKGPVLKF